MFDLQPYPEQRCLIENENKSSSFLRISVSETIWSTFSELNTCQALKNDNIFHIIDQIKVWRFNG